MNQRLFEIKNRLSELSEEYKCPHLESEVRRRTLSNETVQFVHQCVKCGRSVSSAISKRKIELDFGSSDSVPEFDERLFENRNSEYNRKKREILGADHETNQKTLNEFWEWYSEYLRTDQWKLKRTKVLARAKGICEGCGETEAIEVHHLTYKHSGNEFLFELVALCSECHERVHGEHTNKSIAELRRL